MKAPNSEAATPASARGPKCTASVQRDSDGRAEAAQQPYPKRLATLAAAYALAGFELHELVDGKLIVFRWGMSRTLDGLADAERFLSRLGVRHG